MDLSFHLAIQYLCIGVINVLVRGNTKLCLLFWYKIQRRGKRVEDNEECLEICEEN